MSKAKNDRRADVDEAIAIANRIRVSPHKLNLVAALIRGKSVGQALTELEFSRRRIAKVVRSTLYAAIANAENNDGMDIDQLYVRHAYVGKSLVMKRFRARARGRASRVEKPFSNLTIVVGLAGEAH